MTHFNRWTEAFVRSLFAFATASLTFGPSPTVAGTVAPLSTIASTASPAPNNDDYAGMFADNPNNVTFNSRVVPVPSSRLTTLEGMFPVLDSNGTSEYALTIQAIYDSFQDPPLTNGYRLQLGFGTGANFVPASAIAPQLDFDFPLPANPAVPAAISFFNVFPLFDLKSHSSDTIEWSGRSFRGNFSHASLFQLPLDVPDLPASVMNHYRPGDLPSDFPAGAKAFTIRGRFVPEPASITLLVAGLLAYLMTRRSQLNPDH